MKLTLSNLPRLLMAIEKQSPHDSLTFYLPSEENNAFYSELCALYLRLVESERGKMRQLVNPFEGVQNNLVAYSYDCVKNLRSSREEYWLKIGLSAAALADASTDERDMLLLYAELFVSAEEIGLDPEAAYKTLCPISNFENYAVVKSRRNSR